MLSCDNTTALFRQFIWLGVGTIQCYLDLAGGTLSENVRHSLRYFPVPFSQHYGYHNLPPLQDMYFVNHASIHSYLALLNAQTVEFHMHQYPYAKSYVLFKNENPIANRVAHRSRRQKFLCGKRCRAR
ncbi:hypothetical protein AG1IA_09317 [Rhizoctonia solani AG-1 IA]|uniref:Uncharacterized protein n=1 Tax=Thanatephorus cucumeris (strain AG1-IA) TaxID=983506 RepID=L8WIS9_THACA|nr:hypothetical protein AG1IA_09317 [Rhizoctonia solani AG-1 IA]